MTRVTVTMRAIYSKPLQHLFRLQILLQPPFRQLFTFSFSFITSARFPCLSSSLTSLIIIIFLHHLYHHVIIIIVIIIITTIIIIFIIINFIIINVSTTNSSSSSSSSPSLRPPALPLSLPAPLKTALSRRGALSPMSSRARHSHAAASTPPSPSASFLPLSRPPRPLSAPPSRPAAVRSDPPPTRGDSRFNERPDLRRPTRRWARLLDFLHPSRRRRSRRHPDPTPPSQPPSSSFTPVTSTSRSSAPHPHVPSSSSSPSSTPTSAVAAATAALARRPERERERERRRTLSDGGIRDFRARASAPPRSSAIAAPSSAIAASVLSSSGAVRYRRGVTPDDDFDGEPADGRTAGMVSSALAELDAIQERDLFAVVNRLFDDYQTVGPPASPAAAGAASPGGDVYQASSLYVRRSPAEARRRLTMRVHNAYYISGRRSGRGHGGMHATGGVHHHHHHLHHHAGMHAGSFHHAPAALHAAALHAGTAGMMHSNTQDDRDMRWNMRTVRVQEGGVGRGFDAAASDEQIEALPTFVMEKGETRSVREIFESMRERRALRNSGDEQREIDVDGDEVDEEESLDDEDENHEKIRNENEETRGRRRSQEDYDGLMTSYTECAICLCDFEPGDEITALPCGHFFHLTGCVREWLAKHARTCPTCRADICGTRSGASEGLDTHSSALANSMSRSVATSLAASHGTG